MPVNVVKSREDEKRWSRAKSEADKGGYKGKSKWKVTMSIFKNMKNAASKEEIDVFLKAAADRFSSLGVPPDIAEQLLGAKLGSAAEQLGLVPVLPDPDAEAVKFATLALVGQGMPEADARVAVASQLAREVNMEKIARVKTGILERLTKV